MKQFLVILFLTALVWLGVSMAEPTEYAVRVRVEMTGYDTVRYAVVRADTALTLRVKTDGYSAFLYSLRKEEPVLQVPVVDEGEYHAVAMATVCDKLRSQMSGIKDASGSKDSVRLVLSERQHRIYRPGLELVDFNFAEQYGLYGQPEVTPAEVTLYGPEEDLARINEVRVAATKVDGIKTSGSYVLPLEPVWQRYVDVRPSCREVSVYVPVEAYVEREYRVPVTVMGADSTVELRVYPGEVTLHVWVAQRDRQRTPNFKVAIDYSEVMEHKTGIRPRLVQFPSYVRPRSIEPQEVQCVIIK